MTFRIKEVNPFSNSVVSAIHRLHNLCFGDTASLTRQEIQKGYAWLVYSGSSGPVAFALLCRSSTAPNGGYLSRVGVLEPYRGNGLQKRLIQVRERKARSLGWTVLVTDTTGNIPSSNSLIRAGYTLYQPDFPWAFAESLYWRKFL